MDVKHALIPAAGRGERLDRAVPKPLVSLASRPLIGWNLQMLSNLGVKYFTVVTGYKGDQIESFLEDRYSRLNLNFIRNERWEEGQALSVLSGESHVESPFLLLMSDHLFHPGIFEMVIENFSEPFTLAVDFNWESIPDPEDAMLVKVKRERVKAMDKQLESFNAADTGLFVCDNRLFQVLCEALEEKGSGASLSDGMQKLIERDELKAGDIGDRRWLDVDTPALLKRARDWVESGELKPPSR